LPTRSKISWPCTTATWVPLLSKISPFTTDLLSRPPELSCAFYVAIAR
jgi:hypothetical protein